MPIIYTKHAEIDKFAVFKKHKFIVTKATIEDVIKNPENEDYESDPTKIIASKSIDARHILRVVYRRDGDIITIITFYPAEKGRYYL